MAGVSVFRRGILLTFSGNADELWIQEYVE